jgi:hypothetical protein
MFITVLVAFLASVELPTRGQGSLPPVPCPVNAADSAQIQISRFSKTIRRPAACGMGVSQEHREQVWAAAHFRHLRHSDRFCF